MGIVEHIKKVKKKEIDILDCTKRVLEECRQLNAEYHFFNAFATDPALEQADALKKKPEGKLAGVFISVKDCLCVKGVESTAGSRILEGYRPVMNATAVQRCIDEGAIIIGKTSQDEFGFGGFSVNVGNGMAVPLNPFDRKRSCGGSSGGAAGITQKAAFPHIALAESTGGSIVNPASFCGVFGLCPTYGRVSRYGLMDYANSLDKIGLMGRSCADIALGLGVIAGHDPKDSTSSPESVPDYPSFLDKGLKGMKIGVIKDCFGKGVDKEVALKVSNALDTLKARGVKVEEIPLPLVQKYGIAAYYLLATAEASTNLAKYCGMRYGKHERLEGSFNEYFTKVRSAHFSREAKRRIILGTFARMAGFRDAYYLKALKVRAQIIGEYKKAFAEVDVLLSPTVPSLPKRFDDISNMTPLQSYMFDFLTVGPNLAGLPHLNIPVGMAGSGSGPEKAQLPVGMMVIADHFNEGVLLQVGKEFGDKE